MEKQMGCLTGGQAWSRVGHGARSPDGPITETGPVWGKGRDSLRSQAGRHNRFNRCSLDRAGLDFVMQLCCIAPARPGDAKELP